MKKTFYATVTNSGKGDGEPEMTVSTSGVDRDNDRIIPSGLRSESLTRFMKNPCLTWAHDYSEIPIGTITSLDIGDTGIRARWRWLANDPLADRVKNAWEQGVVRAASVGFAPIESEENQLGGRNYTEWELLEVALVPIPANPECVRTLKSFGLKPLAGNVLKHDEDDEIVLIVDDGEDDDEIDVDLDVVNALVAEAVHDEIAGLKLSGAAKPRSVIRSLAIDRRTAGRPLSEREHEPRQLDDGDTIDIDGLILTPKELNGMLRNAIQASLTPFTGRLPD